MIEFQHPDPHDPVPAAQIASLAAAAAPRCGVVAVVAIDGPSGSGKTTLAAGVLGALQPLLGPVPLVQMEDLFAGWDGLADAPGRLTRQILEPLSRGEPAAYRRWQWGQDAWGEIVELQVGRHLVVEGCGSSVGPAAEYAALKVWVEAPRALRMVRGIARDGETYRPHWDRWMRQERALYAADQTRERADVILHT